jgi:phosphosulfolactate synthase (CoM biosynthesis protein A)
MVEMLGSYLDSVKWTMGTQRLVNRAKVEEINRYLGENEIDVSSGGLLESVIPHGEGAVRAFLEEARELGFTIIEISTGAIALSLADKCALTRATIDAGLKPKPEVFGASPIPGGYGPGAYVNVNKIVHECQAVIDAGAWKVMIEEDGIFDGPNPEKWNRDLAWAIASHIPQEYLFWESSTPVQSLWLIAQFGPDVNLFGGPEWLGYTAALRTGAFFTTGRIGAFGGENGGAFAVHSQERSN